MATTIALVALVTVVLLVLALYGIALARLKKLKTSYSFKLAIYILFLSSTRLMHVYQPQDTTFALPTSS